MICPYDDLIKLSVDAARQKHPSWEGYTLEQMMCILVEEVGEAVQEVNDYRDTKDDYCLRRLNSEILDVIAVAVKVLSALDNKMA